ncbi:MAG TPA: hypothetical protein VMY42_21510, partial [Thermoguttaceae bacterium]|nr:hypothetical protein [Thermoguttaceae bacterium]
MKNGADHRQTLRLRVIDAVNSARLKPLFRLACWSALGLRVTVDDRTGGEQFVHLYDTTPP